MKTILLPLVFTIIWSSAGQELTLSDWIELALENSPQRVLAQVSIDQANTSITSARASLLPSVNLSGSMGSSWTEDHQGDLAYDGVSVIGGPSLSIPLLRAGGADWVRLESASLGMDIAETDARESELILQRSVALAYYRVVEGMLNLDIANGGLEEALLLLERVELLFELRSAPVTDLLAAQAQVTQAEIDAMNREVDYLNGLEALRVTAGVAPESGYLVNPELIPDPMDSDRIDEILFGLDMNPSLISAEYDVHKAELEERAASSERWPSISANGSYSWSGMGDNLSSVDGRNSFSVSVILSLPLFDGGIISSRENSARAGLLSARTSLESERNRISAEFRSASRNLEVARERVVLADENIEYRTQLLDLAKMRYDLGDLEMDKLIEARNDLQSAEYQLISARINCLESEAECMILRGLDVRSGE